MRLFLALFMTVSLFAVPAEAGPLRSGARKLSSAAVKVLKRVRRPFAGRRGC